MTLLFLIAFRPTGRSAAYSVYFENKPLSTLRICLNKNFRNARMARPHRSLHQKSTARIVFPSVCACPYFLLLSLTKSSVRNSLKINNRTACLPAQREINRLHRNRLRNLYDTDQLYVRSCRDHTVICLQIIQKHGRQGALS